MTMKVSILLVVCLKLLLEKVRCPVLISEVSLERVPLQIPCLHSRLYTHCLYSIPQGVADQD